MVIISSKDGVGVSIGEEGIQSVAVDTEQEAVTKILAPSTSSSSSSSSSRSSSSSSSAAKAAAIAAAKAAAAKAAAESAAIAAAAKAAAESAAIAQAEAERRAAQIAAQKVSTAGMTAQEFQAFISRSAGTPAYYSYGKSISPTYKTAEPLSVQAYDSKDKKYYLQSYKESFKQALEKLKKGEITEVLDPFYYSEKLKAEKVAQKATSYYVPQFGTISTDYPTGFEKVEVKEKTYGELQNVIEEKRDAAIETVKENLIASNKKKYDTLQSKVSSGKISQTDAQSLLDAQVAAANKELATKVEAIYEKNKDISGVYERENVVKKYGIMAGDIAGYSIATALAGPIGTVAYGASRGIALATKKESKEDAFLDISEAWGDVLTGQEVTESTMYQKAKARQTEAGLNLLAAGFGGIASTGKIAKDIDVLRLTEGLESPSTTVGKIYDIKKQKYIKSVTRKQTPYYESLFELDAPIIDKGDDFFILGASKAKTTSKFLPYSTQVGDTGWKLIEQEAIVGAKSKVKKAIVGGVTQSKTYASYGSGYVQPLTGSAGTTEFTFGGLTQNMDDFLIGKGGKAKSLKVYKQVSGEVGFFDDIVEIPLKTTITSARKDTSIIFKNLPKTTADDFGLTISKTSKKSSSDFINGLYQTQKQETISKQIPSAFSDFSSAASQTLSKSIAPKIKSVSKTAIYTPSLIQTTTPKSSFYNVDKIKGKNITAFSSPSLIDSIKPTTKAKIKNRTKAKSKTSSKTAFSSITLLSDALSTETTTASKNKQITRQVTENITDSGFNFVSPDITGFGGISGGFSGGGFGLGLPTISKRVKPIPRVKSISKKKKKKYVAKQTGFEAALGLGPRYVKAGRKFTGFETLRASPIKKPKKKKSSKKKRNDNWGLY